MKCDITVERVVIISLSDILGSLFISEKLIDKRLILFRNL